MRGNGLADCIDEMLRNASGPAPAVTNATRSMPRQHPLRPPVVGTQLPLGG